MADIHINPVTGVDAPGNGTFANPYATALYAVTNNVYTDRYLFANEGVHDFTVPLLIPNALNIWKPFFSGDFTIFTAYDSGGSVTVTLPDGTTAVGANIDGGGIASYWINQTDLPWTLLWSYLKFTNFDGTNGQKYSLASGSLYRCEFENWTNVVGYVTEVPGTSMVKDCYFHDISGVGGGAIGLINSNCQAINCKVNNIRGNNSVIQGFTGYNNITISNNLITDYDDNNTAISNLAFGGETSHNTVISDKTGQLGIYSGGTYDAGRWVVHSNLVANFSGLSFPLIIKNDTGLYAGRNGWYNCNNTTTGAVFAQINEESLDIIDSGPDPFVDSGAGDYRLAPGGVFSGKGWGNTDIGYDNNSGGGGNNIFILND